MRRKELYAAIEFVLGVLRVSAVINAPTTANWRCAGTVDRSARLRSRAIGRGVGRRLAGSGGQAWPRSPGHGRSAAWHLEVTVANNLLAQEMGFQKDELIKRAGNNLAPDEKISELRFRVGTIH